MKMTCTLLLLMLLLSGCQKAYYGTMEIRSQIHVSPTGDDTNKGTQQAPLQTLGAVQQAVRELKKDGLPEGGITVYLHGGTYRLSEPLVFTPDDSGQKDKPIVWKAYNNENPVFSGGKDLTSGWSLHENGIYKKTGVTSEFRQLYVNGKTAIRARTPNKGAGYYAMKSWDNDKEEIKINQSEISNWGNFNKVEIVHIINWTKAFLRLSSFRTANGDAYVDIQDAEDKVYWTRAYPIKGGWGNSRSYYFESAYEFLDAEGEWYLDTSADTLYYKPRLGETMGTTQVVAPGDAETLLRVEGTLDNPVKNLTFYGIIFEHSNWLKPNNEGALDLQASQMTWKVDPTGDNNMWVYRPPAGIKVIAAQNITFERNVIRNMGAVGIDFEYGTKDCEIIGNVITQTAANGISIGKFTEDPDDEIHAWDVAYNPADVREICTDDVVKNNYIYKAAEYYSGCAIAAGYPRNLHIEHNEIEDCQYTGISVGYGWTNKDNAMSDNFIAYNRIHNVVNVLQDGGGIYTLSKQPGTEIRENYIYPAIHHGPAIYLDEGTGGSAEKPFIVADNALSGDNVHRNVPSGNISESNNVASIASVESKAGLEPEYVDIKVGVAPMPPQDPEGLTKLDTAGMSIEYVDSEELSGEKAAAANLIDNNINTIWHTQWKGGSPSHPHEVQIDLGATYNVGAINYLPRQDNSLNGTMTSYEIYVSASTSSWGSAVASGTWDNNNMEKQAIFTAKSGRYVRLRALSEGNSKPWSSGAELEIWADLPGESESNKTSDKGGQS